MAWLRGRRLVLVLAGAGIVLAAVAVFLVVRFTGNDASAAPGHGTLPAARLTQLQTALVSQDPAVQAAALDPAVYASLQQSGQPLLPGGSTMTIDPSTARVSGRAATVSATVKGPRSGRFTLQLAQENGTWVVFAAELA